MEIMDSNQTVNGVPRYCASAGCGPITALRALRHGKRGLPAWEHFVGRFVVPVHLGRVAIALLPQLLNLEPGDEVLAPAYNCGSELDPLVRAGLRLVFYRVDRNARIDIEDIQRRATDRTRVVYVTHYFGWAQDLSDLSSWCRQRRLYLVEDCALALFSSGPAGPLGRQGDAAIFSLRKSLPVPDGGVLMLRDSPPLGLVPDELPPWRTTARAFLPLFKSRFVRGIERAGLYPSLRRVLQRLRRPLPQRKEQNGATPDIPADYYFRDAIASLAMSNVTIGLVHGIDPQFLRARRRENYLHLRDELEGAPGLEFLHPDLADGVCPLFMPVLVNSRRSRLVAELNRRGIAAFPFWEGYHRRLSWDGFPEARYLKDHLLTLPVNQALGRQHTTFIAHTVRDLLYRLGADQAPPPPRESVSVQSALALHRNDRE
jgi:dTDP-4-amino-4,6-dideoxygalactose transaminase